MMDSREKRAVVVGRELFQKIQRRRADTGQLRHIGSGVNRGEATRHDSSPSVDVNTNRSVSRLYPAYRGAVRQPEARPQSKYVLKKGGVKSVEDAASPVSRAELRRFEQGIRSVLNILKTLDVNQPLEAEAATAFIPEAFEKVQLQPLGPTLAVPHEKLQIDQAAWPLSLRGRVIVFAVMAFAIAWLIDAIGMHLGGIKNVVLFPVLLIVAQLAPGIAAIAMLDKLSGNRLGSLGLRWGKRRYMGTAYWMMLALALATYAITIMVGWGRLDTGAASLRALLGSLGLAGDIPTGLLLGSAVFSSLSIGMVVTALGAFGEELGWRGYLLTNLLPLGRLKACVITGLIWGVWHIPNILMGNLYPGYPLPGVIMIIIMCLLLGMIFGWLRIVSGSLWPPVVAHAALNTMLLAYFPSFVVAGMNPLLGGGTGIIGLSMMGLVALFLYRSGRLK